MKLIVADDEKWVRAAITNTIPFDRLGLELTCEASNGIEALELCRLHKPDILITDILMPGLSGLELIEKLRSQFPDLKIIIISGYSEFEYSRTAMKLGVSDYILKPVDETELEQALSRAINALKAERSKTAEELDIRSRYKLALPIVHEKFLNSLIMPNSMTLANIKSNLKDYGIDLPYSCYTVAVFVPICPRAFCRAGSHDSFLKLVSWIMRRYSCAVTFNVHTDEHPVACIINHPGHEDESFLSKALTLCLNLFRYKYNSELIIGLSTQSHQLKSLPELYLEAFNALDASFWEGNGNIYRYKAGLLSDTLGYKYPEHNIEKIVYGVQLSDCQPFYNCIDSISSHFLTQKECKPKPSLVCDFFWSLIQAVTGRLGVSMSFIEYEKVLINQHPYEFIKKTRSFRLLCSNIKDMAYRICEHYACINSSYGGNVIEAVKRIMSQNYQNDISLDKIARFVHLNATYLSELFKKDTGMSFVEYKTMLRMENAKQLLLSTGMSASEISSRVGYTDPKYFSKLFKRFTGKTVHKFKKDNSPHSA